MELTTENKVKLKAFYDAGNIEDMGKLMYQLNIKKVPYTQLGKAVGVNLNRKRNDYELSRKSESLIKKTRTPSR